MRILAWRGMLNRSSGRLRALDDPLPVLLFQRVGDLHSGALRRSRFRLEFHLRLGFVALNRKTRDVHVHRAEVYRFQRSEMLIDAGADAVGIVLLFLAAREEDKKADGSEQVD